MIMHPQYDSLFPPQSNIEKKSNTIPKNKILNWLYATDRHVSIEKLGLWLEDNTAGQYKIVRSNKYVGIND